MAKTKETEEVVSSELVVIDGRGNQLPAYLAGAQTKGSGLTGLDPADYIVPRIKLLQGQSEEVKNGLPGAEEGVFWLTVMDQPLGSDLDFTIINNRVRVLLLAPRDDGQGILARADDGRTWDKTGDWQVKIKNIRNPVKWEITDTDVAKSGLLNFGTSIPDDPQSNPAATKFYDFLVYLPAFDLIAVMSLARSQSKKAKELISKVTMARVHMHGLALKAGVLTDTNGTDKFSNYKFALNGYNDESIYNIVAAYAKQFAFFRVDESDITGEADAVKTEGPKDSADY